MTKLQKCLWIIHHPLQTVQESGRIRRFCARSAFRSSLYYAFCSDHFRREHHAVLNGTLGHGTNDDAILAAFRRNIHRLEKGITAIPREPVFAENYIIGTVEGLVKLLEGGAQTETISWGVQVLDEYFSIVELTPPIQNAHERYQDLSVRLSVYHPKSPAQNEKIGSLPNYGQFLALCRHREAVRYYEDRKVPRELLEKAAMAASESPSACNRQAFELFVFDTKSDLDRVRNLSIGTSTFAYNLQCLIFIVGNLAAYADDRDRHLIYIDGSLFAMSFGLALETLGLSSCYINWPDLSDLENPLAGILGILPTKRCIMCMSVGYSAQAPTPISLKKTVKNLMHFDCGARL